MLALAAWCTTLKAIHALLPRLFQRRSGAQELIPHVVLPRRGAALELLDKSQCPRRWWRCRGESGAAAATLEAAVAAAKSLLLAAC